MNKIVLIEDEPEISRSLAELLESSGYFVRTAFDGKSGFNEIIRSKPDLVLCDVNMPKFNGYELLEALSQSIPARLFPVFLFLTARVEREDISRGLKLGADDYIMKPFEFNDLLDTIRMRLEKRKSLKGASNLAVKSSLRKLSVPIENGIKMIDYKNVIQCMAQRSYCQLSLEGEPDLLVSKPMKFFEQSLFEQGFLKVNKSCIVNPSFIDQLIKGNGWYLVLKNGEHITVSSTFKRHVEYVLR